MTSSEYFAGGRDRIPDGFRVLSDNEPPKAGDIVYREAWSSARGHIQLAAGWYQAFDFGSEFNGLVARKIG